MKTRRSLKHELVSCEEWLREHDYIGTKIATGRAAIEDYADEIDKILDYWENLIPVYAYEVEKYVETIKVIVSSL